MEIWVYYGIENGYLDDVIRKTAKPAKDFGSGTALWNGVRDISFKAKPKNAMVIARKIRSALKKQKIAHRIEVTDDVGESVAVMKGRLNPRRKRMPGEKAPGNPKGVRRTYRK